MNHKLVIGLIAAVATSLVTPIMAGDPLTVIPSDVYGVLAVRHPDQVRAKLDELIKSQDRDYRGSDWSAVAEALDLSPEIVNWSQPVVFVLTQPNFGFVGETEFSDSSAVLAFSPADAGWYDSLNGEQQAGGIKRITLSDRRYYAIRREDVVLLGGRRKAMRMLRASVPATDSLFHALDDEQKALYARSDLFVHLPMRGWRERIAFLSLLAANMVKLGMVVEQDAQVLEMGRSVLDWGMAGFGQIIEQMDSLSLGVSLSEGAFRLRHYHRFTPKGSVANYLRQVAQSKDDLWAALPDRPFYALGVFNWQTPPEASVAAGFTQHLYDSEILIANSPPALRKELRDKTIAFYGQTTGSYFLVTSPENNLLPAQLFGGYCVRDAQQGLEQLRFIQQNTGESFSGFLAGGHTGKLERRMLDGQEYFELAMNAREADPALRRQMESLYGAELILQDAVIGPHHVVYSLSAPPGLVPEAIRAKAKGNRLESNRSVLEIRSLLPDKPHGLVVVDLGRFLSVLPMLTKLTLTMGGAVAPRPPDAPGPQTRPAVESAGARSGPMLGWACVVHPTALSGHLAIRVKDAVEAARLLQEMTREMSRTMTLPADALE